MPATWTKAETALAQAELDELKRERFQVATRGFMNSNVNWRAHLARIDGCITHAERQLRENT